MKHLFVALVLFPSISIADANISCWMSDSAIRLSGQVSKSESVLEIQDPNNALDIREMKQGEQIRFSRSLRKKEENYRFAKFYSDFNAWQGLEFSVPKDIVAAERAGYFTSYFIVYGDDGDRMVPGENIKLTCKVR